MIEDSSDLATEKTSEIANRQSYVANLFDPASFHHFQYMVQPLAKPEPAQKDLRLTICDV